MQVSIYKIISFFLAVLLFSMSANACTVVSAIDTHGHVWNANNEDGPFGVGNFINVYPKTKKARYGYYTLCYLSPSFGNGGKIQGGMNEAGLTFDFNAIKTTNQTETQGKKPFPEGDQAILSHLLATKGTVQEVVDFFKEYWFAEGFTSAQMHVADRTGTFAIISASGIKVTEKGEPLVSTNFDICGNADGSSCWRYPIASNLITQNGASLETMIVICKKTAQKTGGTMYSNVQNLTTGDIWFFSKHDPGKTVQINIQELLLKGAKSYSFSNLGALNDSSQKISEEPVEALASSSDNERYAGNYGNNYIGNIKVESTKDGLLVSAAFLPDLQFHPTGENTYVLNEEGLKLVFEKDNKSDKKKLRFFENGMWSFSAWETQK